MISKEQFDEAVKIIEEYYSQLIEEKQRAQSALNKTRNLHEKMLVRGGIIDEWASPRLRNVLTRHIDDNMTLYEFVNTYDERTLLSWRNMGRSSLYELEEILKSAGLSLRS